jgi:hypothetical protein
MANTRRWFPNVEADLTKVRAYLGFLKSEWNYMPNLLSKKILLVQKTNVFSVETALFTSKIFWFSLEMTSE